MSLILIHILLPPKLIKRTESYKGFRTLKTCIKPLIIFFQTPFSSTSVSYQKIYY